MSKSMGEQRVVFAITLGCPKNRVDTERLLGELAGRGYILCSAPEDADLAVVNTCAFLSEAREESLSVIREVAKRLRPSATLAIAGCMTSLFREQLKGIDFPRTILVGPGDSLEGSVAGRRRPGEEVAGHGCNARVLSTARHVAYLKIAEGCSRKCAFCMIPRIRGPQRSVPPHELVKEAQALAEVGVKELILVAQDLTHYGTDLEPRADLATLVEMLAAEVEGIRWVRLMYLYPRDVDDRLLDVIAQGDKVLPYLDLPVQHGDDRVLKAMRRGTSREALLRLVRRVRERIPGVVLRTTYLVGFPGEDEEAFENLLSFAKEAEFELAGVFKYSKEPFTEAYELPDHVPEQVKEEREQRLLEVLSEIASRKRASMLAEEHDAVVEGDGVARLWFQAPEVDGAALLSERTSRDLKPGQFVRLKIVGYYGADFECDVVGP